VLADKSPDSNKGTLILVRTMKAYSRSRDIAPPFSGAFTKFQKASIVFHMSIHLSIHMNNLAPTGWILMKSDIWVFSKVCQDSSSFIKIWKE